MTDNNREQMKEERIRFSVSVERHLKDEFLKIAKENNSDANKVLRAFIQNYVQKNKQKKEKEK